MYTVSQLVVYGIHGVCRILQMEDKVVDRQTVSYYVLEPLSQSGSRYYIPSHNPTAVAKMRPLLEPEQLLSLLDDATLQQPWVKEENRRKQLYREIISSGDAAALIAMLRALEVHKRVQAEAGRKIHICDENFMRDAQKVIKGELCAVLNMSDLDATACLHSHIEGK